MSASLFDSNIWLALTFKRHPLHETAHAAFRGCDAKSPAAFCRSTEQSYLRLASTPALLAHYECPGLSNRDVLGFLKDFRQLPQVVFIEEPPSTRDLWLELSASPFASPKVWMDAYLAALAISANLRFITSDKDFRQFQPRGLKLHLLTPSDASGKRK